MRIYLQIDADREDGKTMSGELVAEALASSLEGESIEVDESTYSVTSVEGSSASARKSEAKGAADLTDTIAEVCEAFLDMNPVTLDGPAPEPTDEQRARLGRALVHLTSIPAAGEAMRRARVKAAGR